MDLTPDDIALSPSGKIIARHRNTVAVYNSNLHLLSKIDSPRSLQVLFVGETPAVSSFKDKSLLLLREDLEQPQRVTHFFPRFSCDLGDGTLLALPWPKAIDESSFTISLNNSVHANEGVLVLVTLDQKELSWTPGKKVAPLSQEQKNVYFNHKAFWAVGNPGRFYLFQASHNYYDEIIEGEHLARHQMDLPGWVPQSYDLNALRGTFLKREYAARLDEAAFGHSRVLGAYRLENGFAVCYVGPNQKLVETTQVAIFDDHSILTTVSEHHGMLFGTIGNTGYFLSPRGDGQEIYTVPLN